MFSFFNSHKHVNVTSNASERDIDPNTGDWYSSPTVTNIRNKGGAVTIEKKLLVEFLSPKNTSEIKVDVHLESGWVATSSNIDTRPDDNNPDLIHVTGFIFFTEKHEIGPKDAFSFEINHNQGKMKEYEDQVVKSFVVTADPDISGTVKIDCAAVDGLKDKKQRLTFTHGGLTKVIEASLGKTTTQPIDAFSYDVTGDVLRNEDETIIAKPQPTPATVHVEKGKEVTLKVYYDKTTHSKLDVTVEKVYAELENEEARITVDTHDGNPFELKGSIPSTQRLRGKLPSTGKVDISVDSITKNNVEYVFHPKTAIDLSENPSVIFSTKDTSLKNIPTHNFVQVKIDVKINKGVVDKVGRGSLPVRLYSQKTCFIYTTNVNIVKDIEHYILVPVRPGEYMIHADNFIDENAIIYAVESPPTLKVAENPTVLKLSVTPRVDLKVPGFPRFLSFGACTDFSGDYATDFGQGGAHASSLFHYAVNGGGEPTKDNVATTIQNAKKIKPPVLPVILAYTCNLSGAGGAQNALTDTNRLKDLLVTFIRSLITAQDLAADLKKDTGFVTSYILNPDLFGQCGFDGVDENTPASARESLEGAFKELKKDSKFPQNIQVPKGIPAQGRAPDYVWMINWVMRRFAPDVTFSWQLNLWGIRTVENKKAEDSTWIYNDKINPVDKAQKATEYLNKLSVFKDVKALDDDHDMKNTKGPDYLAVDRYERDDFNSESYSKFYCFGPHTWHRYFDFSGALSLQLGVPVMPWQISSSRIPNIHDQVADDSKEIDKQHWGTGGSYLLGDTDINSNYLNVHQNILQLPLPGHGMGTTVKDIFTSSEPFDLATAAYKSLDLPLHGIFAILLGGGQTTGVVLELSGREFPQAKWVQKKLNKYRDGPVKF